MTAPKSPLDKLTIAIPLWNDVHFIRKTLESVVDQAGTVLIYDNASTDGSSEIAAEFAAKYPHVKHVRHAENLGGFENFKRPLFDCTTEYFFWVGSHDVLSPGLCLSLVEKMECNSSASLAFGELRHIGENDESLYTTKIDWADKLLSVDPLERVESLVVNLRDCMMLNGVLRTALARACWVDTKCLGNDIALLARLAAAGPIEYAPQSIFYARDFNVSRKREDGDKRRSADLTHTAAAPLEKSHRFMILDVLQTALCHAQKPGDMARVFAAFDAVKWRYHDRRHFKKKLRLWQILSALLALTVIALTIAVYLRR